MKIKKKWVALMLALTVTGGCSQTMKVSAEEMVSNAIESAKEVEAYYAKGSMQQYDNENQLQEEMFIEEFVKGDGIKKVITEDQKLNLKAYALNDGKQILTYEEGSELAYSMDVSELEFPSSSPRDQLVLMLDGMKDTHSQKIVGEEKLNGFDTAHIKLIPKEKDDFMGEISLWVDQKTWFIVKHEIYSGDSKVIMEYSTIDLSPNFEEGTFDLTIPDSVVVMPIEDMMEETEVSVDEAEAALEKPFLLFVEDNISRDSIMLIDLNGEIERKEVNISYSNAEGPAFILTVFETPKETEAALDGKMKIRNYDGEYSEMLQSIIWDEGGLRYSVLITNPDIKVDEIIQLAETMESSS